MEDYKDKDFKPFFCHCALPAMTGSTKCCENCLNNPNRNTAYDDKKSNYQTIDHISHPNEDNIPNILDTLNNRSYVTFNSDSKFEIIPACYNMISDVNELKWFFDHVIMKPQVNESYSAVFVSRHKKLTKEEQETIGLTRKESEFLATQTFRLKPFKDALYQDKENNWTFERFLQRVRRFNVDKYAYTTSKGEPIPTKTLAIIFYVNPCDDIKVVREFVNQYLDVSQAISKAMLSGKTTVDNLQSYQWFGNAENNLKHLKANQKGTRYWLDFDIDVPKWFKEKHYAEPYKDEKYGDRECSYYDDMKNSLNRWFGKGNYVIIDTSGGYHVLVKTSAIKSNPHDFL